VAEVTIRLRSNGPILVTGPFKLIDSAGNEFQQDLAKGNTSLCRCGQSSNKPFCDGSHKACGFMADERAPIV
jgi:CDGSH-type Zn-finger protein